MAKKTIPKTVPRQRPKTTPKPSLPKHGGRGRLTPKPPVKPKK
tara:strand:+ start:6255 stop:6383 length:129 start_codon:yes stop_codon:yes gene_type:complete